LTFGSYLIWALPNQPVFIDPRLELYSEQVIQDYETISAGRDAVALLQKDGADRVLLSTDRQPKLSTALARSGEWTREYADEQAEVWRRGDTIGRRALPEAP